MTVTYPKHTGPTKRQKRSKKKSKADAFRLAVWTRDQGMDRATGQPLFQTAPHMTSRGNCCHLESKGSTPERKYDVANAVLMSELNHILSDHRGGRLLRLTDPETGEPATDASKLIKFTMYTTAGKVLWMRVS